MSGKKKPVNANSPVGNVTSPYARDGSPSKQKPDPKGKKKNTVPDTIPEEPKKPTVVHVPPNLPSDRFNDKFGIVSMRMLPRPPEDQHLADIINGLQRYITETGVERLFINYLEVLLARAELPYNPYPGFVKRLRQHAEGRVIHQRPTREIMSQFDHHYDPTRIDYLYKARHCDFLWGLPSILSSTDSNTLKQYEWLVKDLVPRPETMRTRNSDFSIQAIVALIGATTFHGTFFSQVPVIQLRVEYFIVGPQEKESVDIYLNALISDLNYVERKTQHILLGVTLPIDPNSEVIGSKTRLWPIEEMNSHSSEFWDAALSCCLAKKTIIAEMVFKTDLYMGVYKRGQKLYSFNFRRHTKDTREDEAGVVSYSELTEASLHDGVFIERAHAEAYITMFTPRLELIDKDKLHHFEKPPTHIERHSLMERYATRRPTLRDERRGGKAGDFPVSRDGFEDEEAQEWHRGRSNKVRVDGFQLQLPRRFAPDSALVINPIRSLWQRQVAHAHPALEVFDVMALVIQLILLDRDSYDDDLLVHCYKFLRSSASRTWILMHQNKFIQELIENFEKAEESKIVQHQFLQYKRGMKELLDSELRECSSEMVTASRAIQHRLDEMSITPAGEGSNIPLTPKSILDLRFINDYCKPVLLQFVEDVQPECPKLFEFLKNLRLSFPEDVLQDTAIVSPKERFYGFEDERITRQERQVINVQMCVERETAPSAVVIEAVIMKYLLDTHVDETWTSFLLELIMKQSLPPNPFPRLISVLRQSSMKMNLCFEENSAVVKRLYHASPRLVDPINFIYNMPGCDAHGLRSALIALDTAAFFSISNFLIPLQNTNFVQKRESYRAAVSMAVTGHVPYYGRVDPFLRVIEVVDHIYVKGPTNCSKDGMSLFATIVRNHVIDLHGRTDSGYVILGVFLGGVERRWSMEEILSRRRNFEVDLENVTAIRQPVYLKLYAVLDWRYVSIVKHFRYHYVSYDELEYEEYFDSNPAELYLSVFFDKGKAAFHSQQGGSKPGNDPFNGSSVRYACHHADKVIAGLYDAQDWIGVHRWFLVKALIRQGGRHVAETWRMLHSKAAGVNFLNAINKTLQDLIYYIIERKQFRKMQEKSLGTLQESVLTETFQGYYSMLDVVITNTATLAPTCMAQVLRRRLNTIITRSENSLLLRYEGETIQVLEEVRQMCMAVEQALAFDLHAGSQDAKQELAAIVAEAGMKRPEIMEDEEAKSMDQIDRPQLVIVDHVNEWHYDLHRPTIV